MDDKLNFKLLNLLILIAIICLLYLIRGLWLGLVGTVFSVIAPLKYPSCFTETLKYNFKAGFWSGLYGVSFS